MFSSFKLIFNFFFYFYTQNLSNNPTNVNAVFSVQSRFAFRARRSLQKYKKKSLKCQQTKLSATPYLVALRPVVARQPVDSVFPVNPVFSVDTRNSAVALLTELPPFASFSPGSVFARRPRGTRCTLSNLFCLFTQKVL